MFGVPRGASKHARPRLGNWVLSIVSWFGQWVTLDIMLDELSKTRAGTLICLQMGVMESRRSRIGSSSPGYIYLECPESQAGLHRLKQFSVKSSGSQ